MSRTKSFETNHLVDAQTLKTKTTKKLCEIIDSHRWEKPTKNDLFLPKFIHLHRKLTIAKNFAN
jgi:hypothetical protein